MKKILFVISNLGQGGAERQSMTIAKLLKDKGYNVSFVCWSNYRFLEPMLYAAGIPVDWSASDLSDKLEKISFFPSFIRKALVYFRVIRYIQKSHCDVCIPFMNQANVFCLLAQKYSFRKWRIIASLRNIPHFEIGGYSQTARLLDGAEFIVSNSVYAKDDWLKSFPCHSSKFHVIYNIVTLGDISSQYIPIKEGKVHILVAAGYREQKNLPRFLESLSLLTPSVRSSIKIDWYGQKISEYGIPFRLAEETIENLRIGDIITLHDSAMNIADLMNQSDLVGLFSSFEGLPNAICEAMSVGKPIIMTRVSDFSVLVNHKNGVLCDADNVQSMADALESVSVLTKEQLLTMGKESKQLAENLFSEDNVLGKWVELIEA